MKHRKVFARLLYPRFSLGARYFAVADILHAEVPKRNIKWKSRVRVIACNFEMQKSELNANRQWVRIFLRL